MYELSAEQPWFQAMHPCFTCTVPMAENERSFLWCWREGFNWPQSRVSISRPVYDVGISCQSSYAVLITNMWWKWPRRSTKLIRSLSHLGNFEQNAAVICDNSPCVQNEVNVFPTKWAVKFISATFPKSQIHCWGTFSKLWMKCRGSMMS